MPLDDNLRTEVWEVENRAVTKQMGFQRRCTTWFFLSNRPLLNVPGATLG